ncbi:uncharacterized protein LOC135118567 [Helicoverpa armigera]|uniref:uncharacterized protein LOC135118567 n=1 Tax=Helicoverpa armigera TaxID=29058 RepID=UPI003082D7C1
MSNVEEMSDRARAYPSGDAQGSTGLWEVDKGFCTNLGGCNVFVGGDFNGHVGRMRGNYERVHGGWGFGCQNDEGEALLQAATAFDLAVVNTWFQKNTEHLITYKSGHHVTQIDYFLVRRSSLKNIKDCKVIPGEAVVSQHRPLIMDVILTSRPKAKERRPPKIKWHLLGKAELARNLEK